MIKYKRCIDGADYDEAKTIIKAYADSLSISLDFQGFDSELNDLALQYGKGHGILLLALDEYKPIASVGVRPLEAAICELKRMYVLPEYRRLGIGVKLLELSVEAALEMGYHKIRLDTLRSMQPAISLYKAHGFYEISAYCYNPFEDAVYMERAL